MKNMIPRSASSLICLFLGHHLVAIFA